MTRRRAPRRRSRLRGVPGRALIAFAACLAAAFGVIGPAAALTIQGHVLKGESRTPTAGISVQLHVVRGESEQPGGTIVSGRDGAFRFSGLSDDPALEYYLATEYEGAFYTEGPLPKSGAVLSRDLVVYDVGRDISPVRVKNQHIVVERKADGLNITEIMVFENAGSTAYLGTGLNHAENAGVRLGLPASVKDFQPGMGGDPQTVQVQGRDLMGRRPIPPGTRPFSFTYRVPLSGRMDLSHRLYFPTVDLVVLLDDPKLKLRSRSLTPEGVTEQGGRQFAIYRGRDFKVGQEVEMRLEGAGFWSNPAIYPWLVAPFAIAAVLLYAARRGRAAAPLHAGAGHVESAAGMEPEPHRAPAREARATPAAEGGRRNGGDQELTQVYLYLIAALDRGAERGELPREGADLIRSNLKRRLSVVLGDSGTPDSR